MSVPFHARPRTSTHESGAPSAKIRTLHLARIVFPCQQAPRQPAGILRGESVLRGGIPKSGAGQGIWSALWRSYLVPREAYLVNQ